MALPVEDTRTTRQLTARMSLRTPQSEALAALAGLLQQVRLSQDPDLADWLRIVQAQHPGVSAFERDFPSLCFSLATGVGKTRLIGAMIAWLVITGRSRHFLVLAPNLTIYEKLKQDFTLGHPKYVFAGIPELAQTPPVVVTGEDYPDGRGVRLDYAIPATRTGDLYGADTAPHINIFNIAKINARDNKAGAAKSSLARVRRFQEYLGQSYFDYLAALPDLVVLMDEAHRYYASAGAQAINDLKPVLGIELTATPKTTGAHPRPLKNVVYHYPLARALADGFVKIPAVATRRDFRAEGVQADELERIKLEDGIHHHEYVKVELQTYALQQGVATVKPFMLVVAQDTAHAGAIKARLESSDFFDGRYKNRVIEVHSNLSGEESDESMHRLLEVEHDEATEVVIHVNKLKEGWDVTNLYTIVPLRASASEILTEQTIGRGLRLPYGRRTGVPAVDRLTIIAHDRFQEIIDRANLGDSIIRDVVVIGDGPGTDVPTARPQVLVAPSRAEMLCTGRTALLDNTPLQGSQTGAPANAQEGAGRWAVESTSEQQVRLAKAAWQAIADQVPALPMSAALQQPAIRQALVDRVQRKLREDAPAQAALAGMEPEPAPTVAQIAAIVDSVAARYVENTIDLPRIAVLPTREVTYGFDDFDLQELARINHQPVSQELLLQHLEDNRRATLALRPDAADQELRLEDYLVRHFIDRDEIDYDKYSGLVYKLAGQVIQRLRSYLPDEEAARNVVIAWQRPLADFVWTQMRQHMWTTHTDYVGRVTQGAEMLRPATFTVAAGERPLHFRTPIEHKRDVRMMVFTGFARCCFPYQKFQSVEGEWRLAQILEDDPAVLKWMKPAPGQFRIEWKAGRNYEPDFVVELSDRKLLIEPKQESAMNQQDTQDKARAAVRWCGYASEHARSVGGKPWHYLLVPDTAIVSAASVSGLMSLYERRGDAT